MQFKNVELCTVLSNLLDELRFFGGEEERGGDPSQS